MSHNRHSSPGKRKTRPFSARPGRGLARRSSVLKVGLLLFLHVAVALSAQGTYHILQKGETLYSVARKYKVSFEALAAANGIKEPGKLLPGQRVLIPAFHKVAKGETLFGIAKEYGLSVENLRSANGLQPKDVIKPGDLLAVTDPKAAAQPANESPGVAAGPPEATRPATVKPASSSGATSAVSNPGTPVSGTVPPFPPTVRISAKTVDKKISWPCPGDAAYLDGKLFGIMIRSKAGESEKAVAAGTVVSAGPYRGFGQVAFVQSKSGHIYVYGGNENLTVRIGDTVRSGQSLGKVGVDPKDGGYIAWFFVFRNGDALDPAAAPRDL